MNTSIYSQADRVRNGQTPVQGQRPPSSEVLSEKQQRFEQMLDTLKKRSPPKEGLPDPIEPERASPVADRIPGQLSVEIEEEKAEKKTEEIPLPLETSAVRPASLPVIDRSRSVGIGIEEEKAEEKTEEVPLPLETSAVRTASLPVIDRSRSHPTQVSSTEGASSISSALTSSRPLPLQADLGRVLHALNEAVFSPDPHAGPFSQKNVSLRVEVISGGLLTGAEMVVATQQGQLKMTVRAVNHAQRAVLESIRSQLVNKISSLDQFEIQSEPESNLNG